MWGNKVETLKKNDVLTGQVVDLTHEGHGVVKLIDIRYLSQIR